MEKTRSVTSQYGHGTRYVSGMYSGNGRKIFIRLTEICFILQLMTENIDFLPLYSCTYIILEANGEQTILKWTSTYVLPAEPYQGIAQFNNDLLESSL